MIVGLSVFASYLNWVIPSFFGLTDEHAYLSSAKTLATRDTPGAHQRRRTPGFPRRKLHGPAAARGQSRRRRSLYAKHPRHRRDLRRRLLEPSDPTPPSTSTAFSPPRPSSTSVFLIGRDSSHILPA